jgi:hypothetical protein
LRLGLDGKRDFDVVKPWGLAEHLKSCILSGELGASGRVVVAMFWNVKGLFRIIG